MKNAFIVFAAALLLFTACGTGGGAIPAASSETAPSVSQKGTGFLFSVVGPDGEGTQINIHTEKKTVGDALLEMGMIDGTASDSGFYVTTVNGITADYETDSSYWALYVDGEYSATSVDKTEIDSNKVYSLVYTKA